MIIIQISNSIVHSYLFLTGSLYKEYVVHWRNVFEKCTVNDCMFFLSYKTGKRRWWVTNKVLVWQKKVDQVFLLSYSKKKKHNMVNSINHALEKSVQLLCLQQIFNIVPKDECFCIQVWFSSKLMIQTVVHF